AALIAAITVNNDGLKSSWPRSAALHGMASAQIKRAGKRDWLKRSCLDALQCSVFRGRHALFASRARYTAALSLDSCRGLLSRRGVWGLIIIRTFQFNLMGASCRPEKDLAYRCLRLRFPQSRHAPASFSNP